MDKDSESTSAVKTDKQPRPYGSWPSPISAQQLAAKGTRLGHAQTFDGKLYWLESRPAEKGRGVIVCWDGKKVTDVSPKLVSVGSKAHEYGGGDFLVCELGLLFCNADDQGVYLLDHQDELSLMTELPEVAKSLRYTDFSICPDNRWIYAVQENHTQDKSTGKPVVLNELVVIDSHSRAVKVVETGADFYSYPRVSPDGNRLCWTCWSHPQMPWDGTELWVADIDKDGTLTAKHKVCGGTEESIYQPEWSPDGVLHFVSDRSGWWNLYSFRDGVMNALMPTDNDCGLPQWNFGSRNYCFADSQNIYLSVFEQGEQRLVHIDVNSGHVEPLELPFTEYSGQLHYSNKRLFVVAGGPVIAQGLFAIELDTIKYVSIKQEPAIPIDSDQVSIAKPIQFTSAAGYQSYGYFYEPSNPDYCGLKNEKPPLIVLSHGGPTAAASSAFNLAIQFWTSRGFAVVDVNYGGSTGYGRAYRELLKGHWGINDVNDCLYAARFLVDDGLVDGERLLIRGGSAGGFTTLCALTFHDDFAAGMSRYGVADLEALASDSHKFEVRYLDSLVGDYPAQKAIYQERSPINNTDKLSCPILILQGSEDKVVPPAQSQQLAKALDEKDIPYEYIEFEGEAHGFRQQDNIIRAFESELSFYLKILKITVN